MTDDSSTYRVGRWWMRRRPRNPCLGTVETVQQRFQRFGQALGFCVERLVVHGTVQSQRTFWLDRGVKQPLAIANGLVDATVNDQFRRSSATCPTQSAPRSFHTPQLSPNPQACGWIPKAPLLPSQAGGERERAALGGRARAEPLVRYDSRQQQVLQRFAILPSVRSEVSPVGRENAACIATLGQQHQ
jgi:hypothetical protein